MFFTVEEINLMCCFDVSSRNKLIAEMKEVPSKDLDEEMKEIFCTTIRKLESMTDAEFLELTILPDSMMDEEEE